VPYAITFRVANDKQTPIEISEADRSPLTIILSRVLELIDHVVEEIEDVFEIEIPFFERLLSLPWII